MVIRGGGIAVVFYALAAIFVAGSANARQDADIIVLFDKSGSVNRHDPKMASKAWVQTFLKTFSNSYKINVVAFDEELHNLLSLDTDEGIDHSDINASFGKLKADGLATDLELPFQYLVKHARPATKLAIIISDGEPEVWDVNRGYLSQKVQKDKRYDDLNWDFYEIWQGQGQGQGQERSDIGNESIVDLYNSVGQLYNERNVDIIDHLMPRVARAIGARLIIWDISGNSQYLQDWAAASGAKYLPLRVALGENPSVQLLTAMGVLQQKSSEIVREPLPADHKNRAVEALGSISEINGTLEGSASHDSEPLREAKTLLGSQQPQAPQVQLQPNASVEAAPPPPHEVQLISPQPSIEKQLPDPRKSQDRPTSAPIMVLVALVVVGGVGFYVFFQRRRKLAGQKAAQAARQSAVVTAAASHPPQQKVEAPVIRTKPPVIPVPGARAAAMIPALKSSESLGQTLPPVPNATILPSADPIPEQPEVGTALLAPAMEAPEEVLPSEPTAVVYLPRSVDLLEIEAEDESEVSLSDHMVAEFIDGKVQEIISEAELLRQKLLTRTSGVIDGEFQFLLFVAAPLGSIEVYWQCRDGYERHGSAIDVALQGLSVGVNAKDIQSITKVQCKAHGVTLHIEHANVMAYGPDSTVIGFFQFHDNINSWMNWIEVVSRIAKGTEHDECIVRVDVDPNGNRNESSSYSSPNYLSGAWPVVPGRSARDRDSARIEDVQKELVSPTPVRSDVPVQGLTTGIADLVGVAAGSLSAQGAAFFRRIMKSRNAIFKK